MIVAAGLTPAWQQILVFEHFQPGEVNRACAAVWCGSGKVLNAGIGIHTLGGPSLTLAPLGGPARAEIEREMAALGVPRRWIATQAATRVCTTILDRADGTHTELVENGRPLLPAELDAFRTAYAEAAAHAEVVVLIGSLPKATPLSFYRELVEKTPCPLVLDFRGEGLLSVLDRRPWIVKPNRAELAQTFGRTLGDDAQLLAAMREVNRRGAEWVVVTDGPGPVWASSLERAYRLYPPQIDKVVNPIGSGDAIAAGLAWSKRAGYDIVDTFRFGVAAACENLRQLLPCRLDPARVAAAAAGVRVERVD